MAAAGLDSKASATTIQFGLIAAADDAAFHSIVSFTASGAWSHPPFNTIGIIGDDEFVNHKLRMNAVAPFYKPDDAADPSKRRHELIPGYKSLIGKEDQLVVAACATRDVIAQKLQS